MKSNLFTKSLNIAKYSNLLLSNHENRRSLSLTSTSYSDRTQYSLIRQSAYGIIPSKIDFPIVKLYQRRWFQPCCLKDSSSRSITDSDDSSLSSAVSLLVPPEHLNAEEKKIYQHLVQELEPTFLDVQDISGGCGSTYAIEIVSYRFSGLTLVKQQKLVYVALRDMIKEWHGVRIKTSPP
ncbi:hypothetical protein HI914_04514 [Erysiphe necator]|nr:hypothetical protein HI914_04514 [Erysiphe necator]